MSGPLKESLGGKKPPMPTARPPQRPGAQPKEDKHCPCCGYIGLEDCTGDYTIDHPEGKNFPVKETTFHDASWQHCPSCREDLLPPELGDRFEAEVERLIPGYYKKIEDYLAKRKNK
jgi:hypothetical protein